MANLIGQTFNYLTVIEKTDKREGGSVLWRCRCKCGEETFASTRGLRSNNKKSCGCLNDIRRAERFKKYNNDNRENIIGKKYGKLTVLEITDKTSSGGTNLYYKCKCDCGNQIYVTGNNLKQGQQSCGCVSSKGEEKIIEILLNNNIDFETQKTFESCRYDLGWKAKFDFYLPKYNLLIEYDGIQHFKETSFSQNDKDNLRTRQERDNIKNQWCKENNIPLIRIPYTHYNNLCLEDLLLETSKFII